MPPQTPEPLLLPDGDVIIKATPPSKVETSVKAILPTNGESSKATVVDLDSDDIGNHSLPPPISNNEQQGHTDKAAGSEDGFLSSSEDEFPELTRKARELAQQHRPSAAALSPPYLSADASVATNGPSVSFRSDAPISQPARSPTPAPSLRLHIASRIPGVRSLEVRYKVDQPLRVARLSWACHAKIPEEEIADTVLVWRGMRLYDSGSCRAIGLGVDDDEDITYKGEKLPPEQRQRVRIEATTQAMFEEIRNGRASREQASDEEDKVQESPKPRKPEEPHLRLVLQAKGLPVLKIIVTAVGILRLICSPAHSLTIIIAHTCCESRQSIQDPKRPLRRSGSVHCR